MRADCASSSVHRSSRRHTRIRLSCERSTTVAPSSRSVSGGMRNERLGFRNTSITPVTGTQACTEALQAMGLVAGDQVLSLNGRDDLEDMFDYQFEVSDTDYLEFRVRHTGGTEEILAVEKGFDEDPGLVFTSPVFTPIKTCNNACPFCFIDQQPDGLRQSLYLKDDDWRLSYFATYMGLPHTRAGALETDAEGQLVTPNFFDVLGVRMRAGRWSLPKEDRQPGIPVAVVSSDLATLVFGAPERAVGHEPLGDPAAGRREDGPGVRSQRRVDENADQLVNGQRAILRSERIDGRIDDRRARPEVAGDVLGRGEDRRPVAGRALPEDAVARARRPVRGAVERPEGRRPGLRDLAPRGAGKIGHQQ